jgi:hypothetical protein
MIWPFIEHLDTEKILGRLAYWTFRMHAVNVLDMPINRISFKIGDVMRGLSKKKVPRLENIYRLVAEEVWNLYKNSHSTELIDEAIGFFIRNHKHPCHHWLQHHDLKGISSADVGSWYSDDIGFFSLKGHVIQELLFIKEGMVHQSVFDDLNIEDFIEQRIRAIEVAAPDVVSDILYGTYIKFTPHFSVTEPRPNTEVLVTSPS